jgi:NTP pyrophosphatase (non-canonical NTP hydrolase)
MKEIKELTEKILDFRDKRNWKQYHNSKDLALGLSIEAAELNELFLWKDPKEVDEKKLAEELADVIIYSLLIAENHNFDFKKIVENKLKLNNIKYPAEKFKDSNKKYDEI